MGRCKKVVVENERKAKRLWELSESSRQNSYGNPARIMAVQVDGRTAAPSPPASLSGEGLEGGLPRSLLPTLGQCLYYPRRASIRHSSGNRFLRVSID